MSDNLDPNVNFAGSPRPRDGNVPGNNVPADGGQAGAGQIRLSEQSWYDDGTGASLDGADRPNARLISNTVFKQTDANGANIDIPNTAGFSSLLWVWGQFIDHDMDQTANSAASGSAPISVAVGDPMRDQGGITSIPFDRSTPASGSGPREFRNDITAFLDASMIYGSSQAKLDQLLVAGTAKLKLSSEGTILFSQGLPVIGNGAVAGDTRAGENEALLSMQAIFAREHNRLVDELLAKDPTLTLAQQFEGARARVEAMVQAVTFNEFLPKLLGAGWEESAYTGFKSNINPAISIEFSTAFFRIGHSMLSPSIHRINEDGATDAAGNLALRDAFQQRGAQIAVTGVEDIFRGMATTKSQKIDTFVVEDIRSFLFNAGPSTFGQDLASLNIQRGRDHGLPSYMEMRAFLGLPTLTSFSQISSDASVVAKLSTAYGGDLSKIDLWVGGLAEDAVGGGMVGETFRAGLIDQFMRLRDGDPFWSLGRGFGAAELAELWSTRLSDIITRNSTIGDLQDDALMAYNRIGGTEAGNVLNAQAGRNLMLGFGGADTLNGGASDDHLVGGAGQDRLVGGAGSNVLVGGTEGDTFVIDASIASSNKVRGWEAADAFEFQNIAGRGPISITDGPNGATIVFGQSTTLVEGVTAAALNFVGPAAAADSASGPVGAPIVVSVLANDNDADGDQAVVDPSSILIVDADAGSNGLVKTVAGQGVWSVNTTTGQIAFTANSGFTGAATAISYTVADTFGLRSSPAAVNVAVTDGSGNVAPTTVGDSGSGPAGAPVVLSVLANDSDDGAIDATSVQIVDADSGSNGRTKTVAGQGVWSVNATNGQITFTPGVGFTGPATAISYTVADTLGLRSTPAAVNVTISAGGNAAPTAAPDAGNVNANGSATFNILANDSDDGAIDATSVQLENADLNSNGLTRTVAGQGVWTVNPATGAVTFAPIANYTGPVTSAAYTVADTLGLRSTPAAIAVSITGGINPGQTLNGNGNANTQNGGAGNDVLNGLGNSDTQNGNGGNDVLNGGAGTDTSNGGDGNDVIIIRGNEAQADTMNGGAGLADTIRVDAGGGAVTLNGTNRITNVEIFEGGGAAVLGTGAAETFDFSKFAAVSNVASIRGMAGDDSIIGTAGADLIFGGGGNDTLSGRLGDDVINGGDGNDIINGDNGDDVINGDAGADTINGADGNDTINGGAGNDAINAGTGDDVVIIRSGEATGDTLNGGAGLGDILRIDASGGDVTLANTGLISGFEFFEGGGRVIRGNDAANTLNFSDFVSVTGVASIRGFAGADTIVGSNGADSLFGGGGNDILDGRGGNDTLNGGTGNDTFLFTSGLSSGVTTISDFDASGNDVIRLVGFSELAGLTNAQRAAEVSAATTFAGGGATIDLGDLGGSGTIVLDGATPARLGFTSEDFSFG